MSQPAYPYDEANIPETAYAPEEKGDKREKKEMLRAKVQSLVARYEEEKNRNEELMMELERLREQQRGGMPPANYPQPGTQPGMHMNPPPGIQPGFPPPGGMNPMPQSMQPQQRPGMAPPSVGPPGMAPPPGMNPPGMNPPGMTPGMPPSMNPMGMNPPNPMMGQQFPGQMAGMPPYPGTQPYPGMQQQPASPYGQQQGFGPPPPAQNPMQGFPQPAFPGVTPQSYSLQNFGGMPGSMPPPMPPPMAPSMAPPQPWPQQPSPIQPSMNAYGAQQGGYQPPFPGNQQAPSMNPLSLTQSMSQVMQTIEQVRAKLHQTESIRNGYGYPQQPAYVDYDTVNLLDKLYDQLGDLSRELMRQRSFGY